MKCPNCSKEIRDGATFCGYCGKPIVQPPKAASAAPPVKQPVRRRAAPQPPAPKAPKKKHTGLIVTLCVLAFLLIAGGAFGFLVNRGVIDVGIDSDSFFSFLLPEDDDRGEDDEEEEEDDDRGRNRKEDDENEDEEDDDRDRDRKEDDGDEEEDDDRGRNRDKDDGDKGNSRPRDRDGDEDGGREDVSASAAPAVDTPEEAASRPLNSFLYSDIAVCVVDPMELWSDTRAKPFEGAAERLYWHTDRSLLVATVDDTGGDSAAFTYNYVQDFRLNDSDAGALLDEVVVIMFDAGRQSCYMARYTDVVYEYDLNGLTEIVRSYIAGGDYETAAVYLLKNAKETEASEYLLPASGTEYLAREDLLGLTWEECCFARNEIYARHGRIFSTPAIRSYFESKSWYRGTIDGPTFDANVGSYLSALERANVNLISEYERDTWGGSYY